MCENQRSQTETFELSAAERGVIEHGTHHYEDSRATSIETLEIAQKQRGWVSDDAIHVITDVLGAPAGNVEGVVMFYDQIFRQPVGRHVIRHCDSAVRHINGYQGIRAALERRLSIKPGQMTFDGRSTLLPTCYLENCDKGSDMIIDEDTYTYLTPEAIPKLLRWYKRKTLSALPKRIC